jgi:hypothetical protein
MMSVMNAQPPLPVAPVAGAVSVGEAVALVEDSDGGRVFLRGELVYAWSAEDVPLRRLAAVQLVANRAARVGDVITDKLIRRGSHTSVQALEADIRAWANGWNEDPKAFIWTKPAEQILELIGRLLTRISGAAH